MVRGEIDTTVQQQLDYCRGLATKYRNSSRASNDEKVSAYFTKLADKYDNIALSLHRLHSIEQATRTTTAFQRFVQIFKPTK